MDTNNEIALSNLVRVGIVQSIDEPGKTARVKFPDLSGLISGDLPILKHVTSLSVNDVVLCLYLPVWNGDGFVIGGIS